MKDNLFFRLKILSDVQICEAHYLDQCLETKLNLCRSSPTLLGTNFCLELECGSAQPDLFLIFPYEGFP